MAIAIDLPRFNDLRRPVTPIFLYRFSTLTETLKKMYRLELFCKMHHGIRFFVAVRRFQIPFLLLFFLLSLISFIERDSSFLVSPQEQNTAVDGWNEQISQLTAQCDQLKDSLQEVTKVIVSTFVSTVVPFTEPAIFKPRGNCIIIADDSSSQEMIKEWKIAAAVEITNIVNI